jgi:2-polyprenyl-6-methoxyphenol hydroxylase-like FAD-dependent oxidoreductase
VTLTDGGHSRCGLVVGTDGAYSKIRDMLFGREFRPKYTGQAVWRATVNRPSDVQARYSFYGPRNMAGVNPVSDKQMYIYLVQSLPEFVHLADGQLPAVIREQLDDFSGIVADAREEITDPNQIVYRPITSGLLDMPGADPVGVLDRSLKALAQPF